MPPSANPKGFAAFFALHMRRIYLYTLAPSHPPLRHEVRHKITEFQKVGQAAQRPPISRGNLRIQAHCVGPLRRRGANSTIREAK
jgi:hypothetical protein